MKPHAADREALFEFSLLALALAHGVDDHLSAFELESLADRLYRHHPGWSQQEVQAVVQDALRTYATASDRWERARQACRHLGATLSHTEREQALDGLMQIARADGILHDAERQFVAKIASIWHVRGARVPEGWTALHDLAYLYLALAVGTDAHLAEEELVRIRRSIATGPLAPPNADVIPAVLRETLDFYTPHPDATTRETVMTRLSEMLTPEQRADVLARLVEIANADDRFLDAEEDLLNALVLVWDVDPGVLYGASGAA